MNKKTIIIFCLFLFFNGVLLFAQDITPQLEEMYKQKLEYKEDIYEKILRFIEDNPDSPGIANLYFYLAELSTEVNVNEPAKTVQFYRQVLEIDPAFLQKEAVLYNIGYYGFQAEKQNRDTKRLNHIDDLEMIMNWPDSLRITLENIDYVIYALKELLVHHKNSEYYTRAAYRLGVIYFELALDAKNPQEFFAEANDYFSIVADQVDDPLHYLGMFQQAWTNFTSGNYQEALVNFTRIIKMIEDGELKEYESYFKADAIENSAYSLIEYDASDYEQYSVAAEKARTLFSKVLNDEHGKEIILKAVDLKLTYNAPMQAADLYAAYIDLYPAAIESPFIVDSMITIYGNNPDRIRENRPAEEMIIEQYKTLVEEFNAESDWFQANKDKEINDQLAIITEAYEFLEPRYYNNFADNRILENYQNYKDFAQNYKNYDAIISNERENEIDERIVNISQTLAEEINASEYYFLAINDIKNYIRENPESEKIAEYNEMLFYDYEQIYNTLKPTIAEQTYQDSINNIVLDESALDSIFVQASNDYEDYLLLASAQDESRIQELIRIIYRRAELNYANEKYKNAAKDYNRLLSLDVDNEKSKIIYSRLAEISQEENDYAAAEQYYREAFQFAGSEEKETYKNNILAIKQQKATTFADSANFENAAAEYLELASEVEETNLDESNGYILKAIENYQNAGRNQTAIDLYLEIASRRDTKDAILAAYLNAWTISDSINDWQQSEKLRREFIDKFSGSNEAFRLRRELISFYEDENKFNDKAKAAEMYITLHNDAPNIDIGENEPADIFLNAIRIHNELENEDKIIELSLKFDEMYPDHERANGLLTNVARIYKERGKDQKFEDLAAYLYQKDPTIDLLLDIAKEDLKNLASQVDSLFKEKQYDLMQTKISEFKTADQKYKDRGLNLPTDGIYDQFDYNNNYIAYHNKFQEEIRALETGILAETPDELIRVNNLTKWKDHLTGGRNRIPNLLNRCRNIQDDVFELVKEGNKYNLKTEERTKALYKIAEVYKHCGDAVITQVDKFINVSDQIQEMKDNPVTYEKAITGLANQAQKYRLEFTKGEVIMANTILDNIRPDEQYSDQWTELALQRLVELGLRAPKVYQYLFTSDRWRKAVKSDPDHTSIADSLWDYLDPINNITAFDSAGVYLVTPDNFTFLNVAKETEMRPEIVTFEYSYQKPIDIFINGNLLEKEPDLQEELMQIGDKFIPHYLVTTTEYFTSGWNDITFRVPTDTLNSDSLLFAAKVQLQYDKEKLEYARTTEKRELLSDLSWLAHRGTHDFSLTKNFESEQKNETDIDTTSVDSLQADALEDTTVADSLEIVASDTTATDTTEVEIVEPVPEQQEQESVYDWVQVGNADFQYYKFQMTGLEETEAIGIWHPAIDTVNAQTVTLKKDLYLENEVLEAKMIFIGEEITNIYVNEEQVVEGTELVFDEALKKVKSNVINISNFKIGDNEIIVEVTGGSRYKGFICEMRYTIKKSKN